MVREGIKLDDLDAAAAGAEYGGCGKCGAGGGTSECGNGLEEIYPTTAVRFGHMRHIGEFSHQADLRFTCGAKVIIQTKRGIEVGEQVSLTCEGCDRAVSRDQIRAWIETCGEESFVLGAGRILREATAADFAEYAHIQASALEKQRLAQEIAERHELPLRVVECEQLFGGERIIYYFTAAERVDFREMVRDLAREYRTRIEMRQIGARDEARLLADFETCGREVCCKVFLKTLRPINMRMAKVQKATLDPSQVSGRCGRLKCCLRYEHVGYEELDKRLPRNGVRIRTKDGEGVVTNRQILTQLVQIADDAGEITTVALEDITDVNVPPPEVKPEVAKPTSSRTAGARTARPTLRRPANVPPQKPARPAPKPPEEQSAAPEESSTNKGNAEESQQPKSAPAAQRQRGRRRRGGRRRGRGNRHGEKTGE